MSTVEEPLFTRRIVDFTARVHRACPVCQAPGQFLADPEIASVYPPIFNPARAGEGVGAICPNCGGDRPLSTETRTKRKEWWVLRVPNWLTRLLQLFSPAT